MTNLINPWTSMLNSTKRRVDAETIHNIFWMTDIHGNYGFLIQSSELFEKLDDTINLNGLMLLKRNTSDNIGEFYFILDHKEDWQIFKALCDDLISVTHKFSTDLEMADALENRLKRWQQLLKQKHMPEMSIEKQMGLFSELSCLIDIVIPVSGVRQAIISWVGPEFDKQDFLLEHAIIEVKSHRTSKGEIAHISSAQQLYSEKEPIYLISYGLTTTENGACIEDLFEKINTFLGNEPHIQHLFEQKLIDYGYAPEIQKEPYQKFVIDKMKSFLVSENFPKITSNTIDPRIKFLSYSIDLSLCGDDAIDITTVLNQKEN